MTGRILWMIVTVLMVLSLVMTACGPTSAPTTPTTPTAPATPTTPAITTAPTTPPAETPTQKEDKPKYGGTLTYRIASDPTSFDSTAGRSGGAMTGTVYEQQTGWDWTKGPAGTGEITFVEGFTSFEDMLGPVLAERVEIPEPGVFILNIRRGVHWQMVDSEAGRLMAGRELTADDIVHNLLRHLKYDDSWLKNGHAAMSAAATVEKTGPWEVTVRIPVDPLTAISAVVQGSGFQRVQPPDVLEKYGNLENWRNAVGTGPFMLVDFVPGSLLSYVKNPNYWEKNPIGPGEGDQLPYVDNVRELIIPDLSTAFAALRVGKLDLVTEVGLIDAQSFWKTTPQLEYFKYPSPPWGIGMRQDLEGKPFADKRVRQAMMLAIDFEAIKNDYFGGEAEIDIWPVSKTISALYQPLEEMPESVQELFRYNPEKAKQLLEEAGYPDGFKASIVAPPDTERIDELSIFKDMWAKVGIDLTLDIKEQGVYSRLSGVARDFDDLLYRRLFNSFSIQMYFSAVRGSAINNPSRINDPAGTIPFFEDLFEEYNRYVFSDRTSAYGVYKKIKPAYLENAYVIFRPSPYVYNFWWPWLKNNYGQGAIGSGTAFTKYAWIDQGMKKSMGY